MKYGVRAIGDNVAAVRGASIVILSVKPQQLSGVLTELKGKIEPQAVVISIIAGKTIAELTAGLNQHLVVRTMPNLPAQICEGITGWIPASGMSEVELKQARMILSALGEEILLDDERQVDMVTAISGSGPAFVFEFMQRTILAAVMIGLPRHIAKRLVLATLRGAARFAERSSEHHLAELFEQVMSPAGTTAAGYGELIRLGFSHSVIAAVVAAHNRAKELGK